MSSSFTTSAAVQPNLRFDPLKDVEPVARINSNALLLVVSPRLGVRNLQEFIALARERPGQVSYGSSGVGSVNHFAAELFAAAAGVRLVHIPYRGMAPALADLAGGNLDMVICSPSSAQAFLGNARVVALAMTGGERMPGLSGIPTRRRWLRRSPWTAPASGRWPPRNSSCWYAGTLSAGAPLRRLRTSGPSKRPQLQKQTSANSRRIRSARGQIMRWRLQ